MSSREATLFIFEITILMVVIVFDDVTALATDRVHWTHLDSTGQIEFLLLSQIGVE